MATLACQRAGLLRAPALAPRSVAVRVGAPGARLPSHFVGRAASAAPVLPKLASRVVARKQLQVCNSAAGAPATPAPFKWGANMKDLAICIGLGVALYLCPAPAGVSGWVRLKALLRVIRGLSAAKPALCATYASRIHAAALHTVNVGSQKQYLLTAQQQACDQCTAVWLISRRNGMCTYSTHMV
jgi:hypothetical protein